MEKQPFLQRWGIHLGYGTIIIGLSGCLIYILNFRQSELVDTSRLIAQTSTIQLERYNDDKFEEIQKLADAYPRPDYVKNFHKVLLAQKMTRDFCQKLPNEARGIMNLDQAKYFTSEAKVLFDSLLILAEQDTAMLNYSWANPNLALFQNYLGPWPERLGKAELSLYFYHLQLWANCTNALVLDHYYRIMASYYIAEWDYVPFLSFESSVARVGEWMEADAILLGYVRKAWELKMKVDGEELPVEQGRARFRKRYDQPGRKTIPVEMSLTDPLTNKVLTYNKSFQVEILPTRPASQ